MKFAPNFLAKKKSGRGLPFLCLVSVTGAVLLLLFCQLCFQDKAKSLPLWHGEAGEKEIVQAGKVEEIIRFHVRAHSNSPEEQEIKNYLAREILRLYAHRWRSCSSREELRNILSEDRREMEIMAEKILAESGFKHNVGISLGKSFFPARLYEGKLYPPGEYEAVVMVIGDGGGENWWCVLFPPLCFNVVPLPSHDATNSLPAVERDASRLKKPPCRFWLWETLSRIVHRFRGA